VLTIHRGGRPTGAGFAFAVLAIAFVAEGSALMRALRQLRREAGSAGRALPEHVRRSPDTTLRAVLFEDTTALIGLVIAAAGRRRPGLRTGIQATGRRAVSGQMSGSGGPCPSANAPALALAEDRVEPTVPCARRL
jgi:hypothetical protein